MTRQPVLLAIDGGQTSTKSLLATSNGQILATGLGGPSDHFHSAGGIERNRTAILGAASQALASANAAPEDVVAIALGLTGVHLASGDGMVVEEIARELVPNANVRVVQDYVTNLAGASAGKPGVVVVAGGGAISYGVTADGSEALSNGFGYMIGDEGSGYDIGRQAIAAAARASDGRGPDTLLNSLICSAFGIEKMRQVTRVVYHADFRRDRISRLAPLVVKAARQEDQVALSILARAGSDLAVSALAVIHRLHQPGDPVGVYPTGGVFTAGNLILQTFRETIQAGWSTAAVHTPAFPPTVGGLILAAQQQNLEMDDAWLDRVRATLPR
ncbi:MAG: hypothetical protein H0W59_03010 [Chloroflexia bacterium]|nr:hypothetical protein [Chloroflexia bacterium]